MIYTHKMTFDDGMVFLVCDTPDGLAWESPTDGGTGINEGWTIKDYEDELKAGTTDFILELIEPEFEGNE